LETLLEIITGVKPSVAHMRPFFTKTFVTVPKAKRKQLEQNGDVVSRAEVGRLIGYHGPFSTTPKVMLGGNRIVHSINVTYDISDYKASKELTATPKGELEDEVLLPTTRTEAEEASIGAPVISEMQT
jgi:hypothetical protein